jgi:hypothetical protein
MFAPRGWGYLFIDLIKVTIKIAEININAPAAIRH